MDTNRKATLCKKTLENAYKSYPNIRDSILHSDRGTQYTSELYGNAIKKYDIQQSMNSAGGRSMIMHAVRACGQGSKKELLYDRYDISIMTVEEIKTHI